MLRPYIDLTILSGGRRLCISALNSVTIAALTKTLMLHATLEQASGYHHVPNHESCSFTARASRVRAQGWSGCPSPPRARALGSLRPSKAAGKLGRGDTLHNVGNQYLLFLLVFYCVEQQTLMPRSSIPKIKLCMGPQCDREVILSSHAVYAISFHTSSNEPNTSPHATSANSCHKILHGAITRRCLRSNQPTSEQSGERSSGRSSGRGSMQSSDGATERKNTWPIERAPLGRDITQRITSGASSIRWSSDKILSATQEHAYEVVLICCSHTSGSLVAVMQWSCLCAIKKGGYASSMIGGSRRFLSIFSISSQK